MHSNGLHRAVNAFGLSRRVFFFFFFKVGCQLSYRLSVPPRGLHGLKTEARTRPVPEIVWPDPTRAAQLNLEPEPDPKSPPPPITNKKKRNKIAFHDCMQRNGLIKALPFHKNLPVMKVCEHQVQRSHTFCRVYEFCLDKKMMTVQIMVIFCQLRLVSILSTLNQT